MSWKVTKCRVIYTCDSFNQDTLNYTGRSDRAKNPHKCWTCLLQFSVGRVTHKFKFFAGI